MKTASLLVISPRKVAKFDRNRAFPLLGDDELTEEAELKDTLIELESVAKVAFSCKAQLFN